MRLECEYLKNLKYKDTFLMGNEMGEVLEHIPENKYVKCILESASIIYFPEDYLVITEIPKEIEFKRDETSYIFDDYVIKREENSYSLFRLKDSIRLGIFTKEGLVFDCDAPNVYTGNENTLRRIIEFGTNLARYNT